ncbi:MAG: glycosyltransferase family 9 protein [Geobacteraceae bacterium]|nr:glycosyltransferase family 9 protein [Geobacteraceae bacterium]
MLRSILFIRPGGIGDAVLLMPAILAFRERYPGARITVLAEKRNGAVFGLCRAVDALLLYDRGGDLLKAVLGKYDAVIDTEQWHRLSAVVARLTRAPLLIGYGTNERRKLFSDPVPYSHDDYEAESFLHLLEPLDVSGPAGIGYPYLTVPATAAKKAAGMLAPLSGGAFAVIFPGATIPERRWGAAKFRELAERLAALDLSVVVIGGMADVAAGEEIAGNGRGLNLAGRASLAESTAIIEKGAVLVSGDSGILHIGVGLGKPTVSLFGPGIAKKWAPRGNRHHVVNKQLPCSPCTRFGHTPKCPVSAKCLADIAVDEVVAAVKLLIGTEARL